LRPSSPPGPIGASSWPATTALLPRRGFLTLDFGVILKGYCSDMTRTVYLGKPKLNERNAYEAVLEARNPQWRGRCRVHAAMSTRLRAEFCARRLG